jgi:hypothetical protein
VTAYLPQMMMTVGLGSLALLALGAAVHQFVRLRRAVPLFLIIGAAIGSVNEAPLDLFVSAYYPRAGQWPLYESFGRPIPVWVLPAHVMLFAAAPYVLSRLMRATSIRRVGWIGCLGLAVSDLLIELPDRSILTYYGDHPFRVFGFPVAMAAVNAATMTAIAVTVLLLEPRLRGRYQVLAAVLPLAALPAGTLVTGFPVFGAVAAGASAGVIAAGGLVSIALSMLAVHGLLALAEWSRRVRSPEVAAHVS